MNLLHGDFAAQFLIMGPIDSRKTARRNLLEQLITISRFQVSTLLEVFELEPDTRIELFTDVDTIPVKCRRGMTCIKSLLIETQNVTVCQIDYVMLDRWWKACAAWRDDFIAIRQRGPCFKERYQHQKPGEPRAVRP